ncbi:MAG TPA: Fic family protein [Thermomicrobiales bacterium]|nr:Fic family protein [Thermomicrobiales bacterium]
MPNLDSLIVSPRMVRQIASIDEFRGSWQALRTMPRDSLTRLLHVATIESIGSSTRIEGSRLSNAQVDNFLTDLAVRSFQSRDEQEVAGYAEVMQAIFDGWTTMPFSEATIRQLHRMLLAHSPREDWHRGSYKTTSNAVAAFDADGRNLGIVFQTAEPFETPQLLRDLVDWTVHELAEGPHHPLLVIGAFVVTFLQIHPFQDGNGRLSRVLTTLLLLKEGYSYVPYSSLESVVERNKGEYYRTLRQTQMTLRDDRPDWHPWLDFFLTALQRQASHLRLKAEQAIAEATSDRSLDATDLLIIEHVRQQSRATMAELIEITNVPRATLKLRLGKLVDAHRLARHGAGRSTWYGSGEIGSNDAAVGPNHS